MTDIGERTEWPKKAIALPLSINLHDSNIAAGVCGDIVSNLRHTIFKDAELIVVDSFGFKESRRADDSTAFTKRAMITAWQEFRHHIVVPDEVKLPTNELSPSQLEERIQTVTSQITSKVGYLAIVGDPRLRRFGVSLQGEVLGETGQLETRIEHRDVRDGGILVPDGEGGWRKYSGGGRTADYLRD